MEVLGEEVHQQRLYGVCRRFGVVPYNQTLHYLLAKDRDGLVAMGFAQKFAYSRLNVGM